jgi:hypothetical protein
MASVATFLGALERSTRGRIAIRQAEEIGRIEPTWLHQWGEAEARQAELGCK